ncbi:MULTISPECIES: nicotinate-nucleotide adenylyltransferase [unclassified Saccharibacter]|uniref:nicotinate-nucleotide adenylyltransferase n=1 Tax=unclassified Saccharibacter TaxID=2648722 RepID=UPI001322A87D|nr:nicotinate-nucleotide adenylyltransferase [Saccharibacter sp. EH611]MXV57512.1 nicotinate-nucleotide adenylyltransferase [Saccharibacter sp. EH70]MXV65181.1 nicotinate-nucleotide adenylyltransferase [Saccharibacter sp. EH60]
MVKAPSCTAVSRFGDGRRMRIGLLGGSFNPAHEGHRQLAKRALSGLQLDQVWLMVSPGNPLKPARGMAPFKERLKTAQAIADGRRIVATDIEQRMGERYTVRTVDRLKTQFPHCQFVWLMGADGLANFARWRRWRRLAELVPIVVFPRPGSVMPALRGPAASVLRHRRHRPREASVLLKTHGKPGWTFLSAAQNAISSTALRKAGHFRLADQT